MPACFSTSLVAMSVYGVGRANRLYRQTWSLIITPCTSLQPSVLASARCGPPERLHQFNLWQCHLNDVSKHDDRQTACATGIRYPCAGMMNKPLSVRQSVAWVAPRTLVQKTECAYTSGRTVLRWIWGALKISRVRLAIGRRDMRRPD